MAWVVDASVVLDLLTGDPQFEPASTTCLHAHLADGLVASPITFVELGPAFSGDDMAAEQFLKQSRIGTTEFWTGVAPCSPTGYGMTINSAADSSRSPNGQWQMF